MTSHLIRAALVYDGTGQPLAPSEMGAPNADQLQGTPLENLCELACRICYDSLGAKRSRGSKAMHEHIAEVKHLSVYEHANVTIEVSACGAPAMELSVALALLNRPGTWVERTSNTWRVTMNLRALAEWDRWSMARRRVAGNDAMERTLSARIRQIGHDVAPVIIAAPTDALAPHPSAPRLVEPASDHERWVSLYMAGSRGLTHELVRHGDFSAISQRSTRYVDESHSDWVPHPLISAYAEEAGLSRVGLMKGQMVEAEEAAKEAYRAAVETLEAWLVARGVDRFTARKQARGAARGHLGNALHSELIFSANVLQWRWMIQQRACAAADAEIRELFCKALPVLQSSRYGARFADLALAPSPDGLGQVVVGF